MSILTDQKKHCLKATRFVDRCGFSLTNMFQQLDTLFGQILRRPIRHFRNSQTIANSLNGAIDLNDPASAFVGDVQVVGDGSGCDLKMVEVEGELCRFLKGLERK